jgi:hypothetical protein
MFEGRNQWVVLTTFLLVLHEVVYFGSSLPFFVSDYISTMGKYKIQQVCSNNSWRPTDRV